MIVPLTFRKILDAFNLDYLPENHCPPAYGFQAKKTKENKPGKSAEKTPDNLRKVRPGFAVDVAEEGGNVLSAWKAEKYDTDTELTDADKEALRAAGLSLTVARVVKEEKVKNNASNQTIADRHHVKGRRDGFGKSTIDKIAAIVAPSTDRGVNS